MNVAGSVLHNVTLVDGRSVSVLSSPDHLKVADDKGLDMTLAHHLEAVSEVCLNSESPCVRPTDKVALASFEASLVQALQQAMQVGMNCSKSDAKGVAEAFDERWMELALCGETAAEVATNVLYQSSDPGAIDDCMEDVGICKGLANAEQLKMDLVSHLGRFMRAYGAKDNPHKWLLEYIGVVDGIYSDVDFVSHVLNDWLVGVCRRVEMKRGLSTLFQVSPKWLPRRLQASEFYSNLRFDPDSQDDLNRILGDKSFIGCDVSSSVKLAVELFPVDELYAALVKIGSRLDTRTYDNAAYRLGDVLGCFFSHDGDKDTQKNIVVNRRGRFVRSVNYRQRNKLSRIMLLNDLADKASVFEKYAGVEGLTACLEALVDAENELEGEKRVSGRTRLCEGMPVEMIVYKAKFQLRFESFVFEALVGFIKEHHHLLMPPLELS